MLFDFYYYAVVVILVGHVFVVFAAAAKSSVGISVMTCLNDCHESLNR